VTPIRSERNISKTAGAWALEKLFSNKHYPSDSLASCYFLYKCIAMGTTGFSCLFSVGYKGRIY